MTQYDSSQLPTTNQSSNSLMSFACGVMAGAALALFFAPASGRETRSYLKKRGRQLADDVSERGRETWNQQVDQVTSVIQQGREKVAVLSDQVNQAIQQGKAGYREAKRAAGADAS